jgi:hypothetical protein
VEGDLINANEAIKAMVPRVDLLKCKSELRAVTEEAQVDT